MPEPMQPAPVKRRRKKFLIGAFGGLLALLLVYPVWFPWVLKPVAASLGLRFERAHRHAYARIELINVSLQIGSSSIRANQIEVQMPHRWLWTRWVGAAVAHPQVRVDGWQVVSQPATESSRSATGSTAELLDAVQVGAPTLGKWLRSVVLTNGEVQLPGRTFAIPSVTLQDEAVVVDALGSCARVNLSRLPASQLSLAVSNEHATAAVDLLQEGGEWSFDGSATWQSNRFEVVGRFDRSAWLPAVARLGSDLSLTPPSLFGVDGLPKLQGRAQVLWTNGGYAFDLDLKSRPSSGVGIFSQPLSIQVAGLGDLRALRLNRFELASSFLKVALDEPLAVAFSGSVDGVYAPLNLWVDLGEVEEIPAAGQLSGVVIVHPANLSALRAGFLLQGTNIVTAGASAQSVSLGGLLNWPVLQVTNLAAEFESGGRFAATLGVDLERRIVLPSAWTFDGPWLGTLPGAVLIESMHASGSAEGAWSKLTHRGRVEVNGLEAAQFRTGSGRVTWSGTQLLLDRVTLHLESGSSTLELTGQGGVTPLPGGFDATLGLEGVDLITRNQSWRLKEPARLEVASRTNGFVLELSPLELMGSDSLLAMQSSIQWPSGGSGLLTVHSLNSADLSDFLSREPLPLSVPDATIRFAWDNGPLTFHVGATAEWHADNDEIWSMNCEAQSDGTRLVFDPVRIDLNGDPALNLDGHLPLRIVPGAGWRIEESPGAHAALLDLAVIERGPLWLLLERYAGIRLDSPILTFEARGEVSDLRGHLSFRADSVILPPPATNAIFRMPPLEDPAIELLADLGGVEIREASAKVLGQRIEARAHWELAAADWRQWIDGILAHDFKRLSGRMRMTNAEMAALSALAPDVIAPLGTLDLDLSLQPGLRMDGHLLLTDASTRYLKPLGALRNIHADLTLEGWDAEIHTFTGMLGGQPVNLRGELEWRPDGDRRFDLNLTGENLSLIRDPELFVRADLDVWLKKSFGKVARLSGDVTLQHSLLFQDFSMLVGPDLQRPDQRPPYFSIPQPPFGDWQLDLNLKGDRFLHVVSPAFKGEVSVGLQLLGTLREPFTVGTVRVDTGKLLFPFGMVELESGRVDLSREDPYRPRVDFRAVGQNFGYTITVELTGPADAPNLTFLSVPPLTAQQILLMLSAGEIPRADFSYNSTDKASRVGFYIGKEFVNRFIGNDATTERLIFRSGEYVTEDGTPTYSLEYRLRGGWSAFGEYNRFRDFNSGLKLKVLSK